MSDLFDRVTSEQDIFKKILGKLPGFSGYFERENRRASDKLLREVIANRYEELWRRLSELQKELISQGGIAFIDDLESAAIKMRQFVDRVKTASYGYAGLFDAVKIDQEELAKIYQYDLTLLEMSEELKNAVDNVESSIGTDGLKASIRHLVGLATQSVEAFNKRSEVILGTQESQ